MHFVWNKNYPKFAQFNLVDIYLYHEDTLEEAASQKSIQNQLGRTAFAVNDEWWGQRGDLWAGTNLSYPMFFKVVENGSSIEDVASAPPQATFTAIREYLQT